jgi:hypothetical protein
MKIFTLGQWGTFQTSQSFNINAAVKCKQATPSSMPEFSQQQIRYHSFLFGKDFSTAKYCRVILHFPEEAFLSRSKPNIIHFVLQGSINTHQ